MFFYPGTTQLFIDSPPYGTSFLADSSQALAIGTKYHITWELNGSTQTIKVVGGTLTISVTVPGITAARTTLSPVLVYAGDTFYTAASAIMTNLIITSPAVPSADVCYNSTLSAFVAPDEAKPVVAPGSLPGWYFEHYPPAVDKINWYSYNLNAPIGSAVNPGTPIAYSDISTVYAVVNFLDCPAAYPTRQGPYLTLYTQDCLHYPNTPPSPVCFYGTKVQWRFPSVPPKTPLCGRLMLWAGTTAPPANLHPDVGARFQLSTVTYFNKNTTAIDPPQPDEVLNYVGIATDSLAGNPKVFTVESEGYIGSSFSQDVVLTFCGPPTAIPTANPTAAPSPEPTAKPSPEPTAKPTAKPSPVPNVKPTAKPTSKPPPEPAAKPTAKPSSKPKSFTI